MCFQCGPDAFAQTLLAQGSVKSSVGCGYWKHIFPGPVWLLFCLKFICSSLSTRPFSVLRWPSSAPCFTWMVSSSSSLLYLNQGQGSYFRERRSVDFHQSPSHLQFLWFLHPLLYGPQCPGKAEGLHGPLRLQELHGPLRALALQTVDQVIFQAVELEQWFSNSKYIGQLHLFHLWNFLKAQMPWSFIQEVRLQFRNLSV